MKTPVEFPENAVREALRAVRPDAQAFERAVMAKIDARKNGSAQTQEPRISRFLPSEGDFLRRAASFLPPGLFSTEATVVSATSPASSGGVKSLLQSLLLLLALPWFFLTALLATGIAAKLAMGKLEATSPLADPARTRQELRGWFRANRFYGMLILLVLGLAAAIQPVESLTALLLVSMLAMALVVRKMNDLGLANRQLLGEVCASSLFLGGIFGMIFHRFLEILVARSSLPLPNLHWVYAVLISGGLFLLIRIYGLKTGGAKLRVAAGLPALAFTLLGSLREPQARISDFENYLVQKIESQGSPQKDSVDAAARWLAASERDNLKNSRFSLVLRKKLAEEESASSPFLSIAARIGGFETEIQNHPRTSAIVASVRQALVDQRGATLVSPWGLAHGNIPIALAANALTAEEKSALAQQIAAHALSASEQPTLRQLRDSATEIRALCNEEALRSLQAAVFSLLEKSWIPGGSWWRAGGGFDEDGRHPYAPNTLAAVELMEIFGVPSSIDLIRLRNHLLIESWPGPFEFSLQDYKLESPLALAKTESILLPRAGWKMGWTDWVLQKRLLLAALALATLTIWTVWNAAPAKSGVALHPLEPELRSFGSFARKLRLYSVLLLSIQGVGLLAILWIVGERVEFALLRKHSWIEGLFLLGLAPSLFPRWSRKAMISIVATSRGGDLGIRTRLHSYGQSHMSLLVLSFIPFLPACIGAFGAIDLVDIATIAAVGFLFCLRFPTDKRIEESVEASRGEIERELAQT